MEPQSDTVMRGFHDPGEEITVPEAWFGGWGHSDGRYEIAFYLEGVKPQYQILFGVDEWSYVSLINPQNEELLANNAGFEASPFPYVQAGVFINGPGFYDMEVRVYLGEELYFPYKETLVVPAFDVWLYNVCLGSDGTTLTFTAYSYFSLKFKVGDVITMAVGEGFRYESKVISINKSGNARFEVVVGTEAYKNAQESSLETTFTLGNGDSYTQEVYYWEAQDCTSE